MMMTHIYRIVKHLTIYLTISLPLQLVGIVLLAIVIPFWNKENVKLPWFVRWFDLADNYPEFSRTNITYVRDILPQGKWIVYNYIALRNPTNYFSYKYLSPRIPEHGDVILSAFVINYQEDVYKDVFIDCRYGRGTLQEIDEQYLDIGDRAVPGWSYTEIRDGRSGDVLAYEYYLVWKYLSSKCVRIRIGYKLGGKPGESLQEVFVISPFHTFYGK